MTDVVLGSATPVVARAETPVARAPGDGMPWFLIGFLALGLIPLWVWTLHLDGYLWSALAGICAGLALLCLGDMPTEGDP